MEGDSGLFMQWAMTTLQHDEVLVVDPIVPIDDDNDDGRGGATFPSLRALREASQAAEMMQELIGDGEPHAASSRRCCSGGGDGDPDTTTDGNNISGTAPRSSSGGGTSTATTQPVSWIFGAAAAPAPPGYDGGVPVASDAAGSVLPDLVYGGSPATRKAALKSVGGSIYAQDHIIAERKRRERINQRFIELSTVIPGLKKMDKATILSDATRHVKELQEKLKALEDGGGGSNIEPWVLVKKPCIAAPDKDDAGSSSPPWWDSSGTTTTTSPARNPPPLPEIEARFLNKNVMVRIHCADGKGVVARVLAELEELHLSIVHASVMPFQACTLNITITAKVDEGFTVVAEEIVCRLKSAALMQHQSRCKAEEIACNQLVLLYIN